MRTSTTVLAVSVLSIATFARAEPPMLRASSAVPFLKESIVVHVDGRWAVTDHRQIVRNVVPGRSEGQFFLTTPESGVVTRFAYWNGDQEIRGELLERTDAAAMYDAVTRAQRDPGILEELAPGRFHWRIFPFAVDEAKRVDVQWESILPAHGKTVEYRVPLAKQNTSIVVEIENASARGIVSDTHEIQTEALGKGVRVKALAPRGPSGQFVLRWELASPGAQAYVHEDPGREAYVVLDFPPVETSATAPPRDVTFLFDRSASESLATLSHVKAAIREAVAKLGARDRVNVIAFDETTTALYATPRDANEAAVREAQAFVDKTRDGAGTDLPLAIRRATEAQSAEAGRDRLVVLVTDGNDDEAAVIDAVKSARSDLRFATLGIADAANGIRTPLLQSIADARGGAFEAASDGDDATAKLARVVARSTQPALKNARLDLGGAQGVELAGPLPHSIAPGERTHVALRCRPRGTLTAKLVGEIDGATRAVASVDVDLTRAQVRPWVATAWAKTRLDAILAGNASSAREDAVEIALSFELASRYTAFFAIPASETARVRSQLAAARQKKRWLTSDATEEQVAGVDSPQTIVAQNDMMPNPAPPPAAPAVERTATLESPHARGGCASCTIGRTERGAGPIALAIAALGLVTMMIRRKKGGAS
ncbi:MAG TPA: VWA domain-containing protein [Labilithrix sp.]